MAEIINLDEWYNPTEAAERLTANSGKSIDISYVRTLAKYGKLTTYPISPRVRLYLRKDVDAYIVEERGEKSGRAKRQKAKRKLQRERKQHGARQLKGNDYVKRG